MSDLYIILTYVFGIALGLFIGWYIWRQPRLTYTLYATSSPTTKPTTNILFSKNQLDSDFLVKMTILLQHAKMSKDPFEFVCRHIQGIIDTERSNKNKKEN